MEDATATADQDQDFPHAERGSVANVNARLKVTGLGSRFGSVCKTRIHSTDL